MAPLLRSQRRPGSGGGGGGSKALIKVALLALGLGGIIMMQNFASKLGTPHINISTPFWWSVCVLLLCRGFVFVSSVHSTGKQGPCGAAVLALRSIPAPRQIAFGNDDANVESNTFPHA
jgi:hypothetical protein